MKAGARAVAANGVAEGTHTNPPVDCPATLTTDDLIPAFSRVKTVFCDEDVIGRPGGASLNLDLLRWTINIPLIFPFPRLAGLSGVPFDSPSSR